MSMLSHMGTTLCLQVKGWGEIFDAGIQNSNPKYELLLVNVIAKLFKKVNELWKECLWKWVEDNIYLTKSVIIRTIFTWKNDNITCSALHDVFSITFYSSLPKTTSFTCQNTIVLDYTTCALDYTRCVANIIWHVWCTHWLVIYGIMMMYAETFNQFYTVEDLCGHGNI